MTEDLNRSFVVDYEFNKHFVCFAKQLHLYTKHFPREQKFSMVKELNDLRDSIHTQAVLASLKLHKKTSLTDLICAIYLMETKIELCRDLGYFNFKTLEGEEATLRNEFLGYKRASVLIELLKPMGIRAKTLISLAHKEGKW
ncbi:hypothetical protein [Helicobacter rodentium]|uniref:hypothetical protein n=1 Tax=Helicobacter rodentium TaxID=59617 RepID=UPI0023F25766|nr:hypothetical protein [Helicobacter rodentium]